MLPLRCLAEGRSVAAFVSMALVLLLSTFARNVNGVENVPDEVKLAELRSYMDLPIFDGVDDPADLLPDWYIAWRIILQNQTDRLLSAIEKRAAAQAAELGDGDVTLQVHTDDGLGFKIHVVGDSTMRDDKNFVDMRCTAADQGVDDNGNPPEGEGFILNLRYTKTFEGCMTRDVDADFVYFGCGLHFLQLFPDKGLSSRVLDIWVHYERLLEEAVTFVRSGGGSTGRRVPIGEAFMTSHSFSLDRLAGEYAIRVREYEERDEAVLAACRDQANSQTLRHLDWPNEFEPDEMCTLGIFSESGIANLNQRAEEVMDRLDVPIVQGFDITGGQSWASPIEDGRHYPALIPLELSSLLSEITSVLRRERRAATV